MGDMRWKFKKNYKLEFIKELQNIYILFAILYYAKMNKLPSKKNCNFIDNVNFIDLYIKYNAMLYNRLELEI